MQRPTREGSHARESWPANLDLRVLGHRAAGPGSMAHLLGLDVDLNWLVNGPKRNKNKSNNIIKINTNEFTKRHLIMFKCEARLK